jgi:hypothetical protein
MKLSENPSAEELTALVRDYPDLEITKQDSDAAGNCESGTEDFLDMYFNGRTSVKAGELIPYIVDYYGVRLVLEYKFRQMEPGEKKEG